MSMHGPFTTKEFFTPGFLDELFGAYYNSYYIITEVRLSYENHIRLCGVVPNNGTIMPGCVAWYDTDCASFAIVSDNLFREDVVRITYRSDYACQDLVMRISLIEEEA